ncbi:MAG: ABC transporter ATP-binding protein [Candidatus Promineofilum sp.]|nr:ABC transporter ATP-binding protein [Promineifilum sp.]
MTTELLPSGTARIDHMEMCNITKRFPGVLASNHVDFDVLSGEVHALLGENGAGKSTLMKILYGLHQPDEGEIRLNGEKVAIHSPADAIHLGIGMIHQHFMLVPTLTVTENVALGLKSSRGVRTDLDRVATRIDELATLYGLKVDPDALVWQLSVGQQQRVEILKALYRGAALLILDEPTAVLTPQEVDEFFVTLEQMKKDGHALIFISHKLHEVLQLCNRVTVLRDGQAIGTKTTKGATKQQLAEMMVGRPMGMQPHKTTAEVGEVRLSLHDVQAQSDRNHSALRGVSFDLRGGEIVGLAGVSGNGQRELAEVIAGLRPVSGGDINLVGRTIQSKSPRAVMEMGLSYIPEERMRDGVIREFTVSENLILREFDLRPFARKGFLDRGAILHNATALVKDFSVKTPSLETPVKNLSGGNIQKLVLARELSRKPQVIVAAQPTRGLDIGATEYVHIRLREQRELGTATLLISEDLDEILALSDRILVIFQGKIMGDVPRAEATPEKLGLMMAGEEQANVATSAA